jgi:hypothetical protein
MKDGNSGVAKKRLAKGKINIQHYCDNSHEADKTVNIDTLISSQGNGKSLTSWEGIPAIYGVEERKKLVLAVGVVCFGISNNYTMENTEDQHCLTSFFLESTVTKNVFFHG